MDRYFRKFGRLHLQEPPHPRGVGGTDNALPFPKWNWYSAQPLRVGQSARRRGTQNGRTFKAAEAQAYHCRQLLAALNVDAANAALPPPVGKGWVATAAPSPSKVSESMPRCGRKRSKVLWKKKWRASRHQNNQRIHKLGKSNDSAK